MPKSGTKEGASLQIPADIKRKETLHKLYNLDEMGQFFEKHKLANLPIMK